jgi:glycogen phosphorylase
MKRVRALPGSPGGSVYGTAVPSARPSSDYTARAVPHREGVAVPLEVDAIVWQR